MNKRGRIVGFAAIMLIAFLSAAYADDNCGAPVPTAEGPVIGQAVPDAPVCAYRGIPYAAPPVGDLRWCAPQSAPKRNDTLSALRFSPRCMQTGIAGASRDKKQEPPMSEDCLYLNVWRPQKSGKFPVMVWIHGGGLMNGAGSEPVYWGDRLAAKKDVIVVTINYRLAVMGFLALPELGKEDANGSSGNYGLQDQIAALKWVHDNIASFGGDPGNVTIFGESAGGWSVCNIMAAPPAAGLFNKAILESGGCDATKTIDEGYADGEVFSASAGCSGENKLACLRSLPAESLLKAAGNITESFLSGPPKFVWLPHEDGYVLKKTPIEAILSGEFNKTPLMVGSTRDEGRLMIMMAPGIRKVPSFIDDWYVKKTFGEAALDGIKKYYPYKNYSRPTDAVIDAMGDIGLGCKCFEGAEASAAQSQPVYYYRFDYDDHRAPEMLAAAHATELPLVFGNLDRGLGAMIYSKSQARRAKKLVDAMMSYWTNFARSSDPNESGLLNWPVYNAQSRQRMYLDLPMRVKTTDNVERCEYWKSKNIRLK